MLIMKSDKLNIFVKDEAVIYYLFNKKKSKDEIFI